MKLVLLQLQHYTRLLLLSYHSNIEIMASGIHLKVKLSFGGSLYDMHRWSPKLSLLWPPLVSDSIPPKLCGMHGCTGAPGSST